MNKTPLLAPILWLALSAPLAAQTVRLVEPLAPAGAARSVEHIVVLVNAEPITSGDVRARLALVQAPPEVGRDVLARQVLERLIDERIQLQWAEQTGVRVDEAAVDAAEDNVARQNGLTREQFRLRLPELGLSPATFRQNLRNELLLQRVREREVASRVRVSEQDIDAYLRQHEGGASNPAQTVLHLAQLLVQVPEHASEADVLRLRQRAQEAARRARSGEDFAALVRTYSDAPDAAQTGGSLGRRSADRYPSLFFEATRALRVGQVSEPVRSGAGFHVLKVLENRHLHLPDTHFTETRARHILLRPSAQLSESAALERLAHWREQVRSGQARFEDLARAHSQDGSAAEGGDLGWAAPGQFVPEFEQTMDRLAVGEVSAPLRSRFGLHLIQVQERRQAEVSRRDQREWVRNVLRQEQSEPAYQEWAAELRARAFIEYREPLR